MWRSMMVLALVVGAGTSAVTAVAADNPQVVVERSIQQITERLTRDKELIRRDPKALERLIEEGIEPFVDVPGIARSVMGAYHRQATPAQRAAFVRIFRDSMIRTYANGLGNYDNQRIVVRPYRPGQDPNTATILVDVTLSSGTLVPVQLQMLRRDEVWKARNLIINGMNLGLVFRQRFAQLVEQNRGNLDRAIQSWSPAGIDPLQKDAA